ncbi:hypothetical protein IscW_ISCW002871, partial [Ixodes scapularis]
VFNDLNWKRTTNVSATICLSMTATTRTFRFSVPTAETQRPCLYSPRPTKYTW